MGVGRADELNACIKRSADMLATEIEPIRQTVYFQRHILGERDLEYSL